MEEHIVHVLERFEQLLEANPDKALEYIEGLEATVAEHPEIRIARIEALWDARGAEPARTALEELMRATPNDADLHYALGLLCDELGDQRGKVDNFMRVRELDAREDAASDVDVRAYEDLILKTAEETLRQLPSPFLEKCSGVPILLEDRPSEHLVLEGFDPRALGLFEGPNAEDLNSPDVLPAPTRVVLYTTNLLSGTDDDEDLADEVETTVLHELGHFFGMDEDDMERVGLD